MKKHRFLAIFLSVFLLASTMFVACSGDDDTDNVNNVPIVNIDYKARVDAWKEYIEYDADAFTTFSPVKITEVSKVTDGESATSYGQGVYFITNQTTVKTLIEERSVAGRATSLYKQEKTIVTTVYDSETNEKIASFTGNRVFKDVVVGEGLLERVQQQEELTEHTTYEVASLTKGIFIATKSTYKAVTEEGSDVVNYELVKKYRYYDIQNNALTDWEDEREDSVSTGIDVNQTYATVLDKTYVLNDGIIVATFDKGFELAVPYYTDAVEIGDYAYVLNEKPLQAIAQSGDLTLVSCPGSSIKVIDKDFNIVVDYTTDGDAIIGFGVLSDGNIVFSQYTFLDSNATECDVESSGLKYDVKNILVDVKTGVATEVENTNFVLSSVYTNATELFASGSMYSPNLSDGTMSLVAGGAKIKDGYFLANVQKFNEKTLSSERVIAVLNNKLEIVKELPNVIENQLGYAGFSSEDGLSVKTATPQDKLIDYYVSTNTYEANMYIQVDNYIKGGFVSKGKVYNNNYVEVFDLKEYQDNNSEFSYKIVDDVIVMWNYRYQDEKYDNYYSYTVVAYVENSQLLIKEIDKDYVGYESTLIEQEINDLVEVKGSLIIYRKAMDDYGTKIYDRYGISKFTASKGVATASGKYVATRFEVSVDGSTISKIEETRSSSDMSSIVTSQTITRYSVK